MCTVTFIPTPEGIYLTSNRDEHKDRSVALPPQQYKTEGFDLIYPVDFDSKGTWIAIKNPGGAAVLLNGAFEKHIHIAPYRKSRGLVFLDIIKADDPFYAFGIIDLEGIEPFTLILFLNGKLNECRWDGIHKHISQLSAIKPHIWSSATIYDKKIRQERVMLFEQWLTKAAEIDVAQILDFHEFAGNGDMRNNLVMNRDGKMSTVSITSIHLSKHKTSMKYLDLKLGGHFVKKIDCKTNFKKETFFEKLYLGIRKKKIQLLRWEYWSAICIYGPLYPYWFWLSIKAQSFFFFSAANPTIEYAGFVQERKSDVYKLIPEEYFPKTLLCKSGIEAAVLAGMLENNAFDFPLIAKPDIGERGIQVKMLQSQRELTTYCNESNVDFLIQEYIPYELEAGIFYYRMPGEENGKISGIVGKEFLTVTGDGLSTIENLLKQQDRSLLQLVALKADYGNLLNTVLPKGEEYVLVPYGNHSRGAKFIDLSDKINSQLVGSINSICNRIPGFYFGRLDIKFRSWEELAEGKHFSIIELNGAGSEPTHIYDPTHSLLYAWKEICRHWNLLCKISRLNARQQDLALMTISEGIKMKRTHSRYLKSMAQT